MLYNNKNEKQEEKKKYLIIEMIYTTKDKKEEKEGVFTLPWNTQVSTSQQLYFSNLVSQLGNWPSQLDPVTLSH